MQVVVVAIEEYSFAYVSINIELVNFLIWCV